MTTGTQWITSGVLADVLGVSENGACKKARRSGWATREVANPGGGRPALEYSVADLPEGARAELARRLVADVKAANPEAVLARRAQADDQARGREAGAAELGRLSDKARRTVEARLWVCDACERYTEAAGAGLTVGRKAFVALYMAGDVEAPGPVRRAVKKLSARTLSRWQSDLASEGPVALAPSYGKRSARTYQAAITEDNELGAVVLAYLLRKGGMTTGYLVRQEALRLYATDVLTQTGRVPSVRSFEKYLKWLRDERPQVYLPLADPARARGQVMPAFGSASDHVVRGNQVWELDSTLADIELVDVDPGTGEQRKTRHALIACVDVFSRRARVLVSRSSRSVSVAAVLRRCLLEWGVPEVCHLDNGKDYTSHHVTSALRQLEIERQLCKPFAPWEKPHVERFIGTLQRHALTPLPGYIGANVAQRQAIRGRTEKTATGVPPLDLGEVNLTPEELQQHLDTWIATVYSHREHGGLDKVSPFERAAQSPVPVRRLRDERTLDVLLAKPAGSRQGRMTVGKKGIQYQPPMFANSGRSFFFYSPALAGGHMGTEIVCREDATDIGKLWAFTQAGDYIGVLVCPDLLGMSSAQAKTLVSQAKRTYATAQRETIRAAKRAVDKAATGDVLHSHREAKTGADRVAGQITPSIEYSTDAIEQSRVAARPTTRGPVEPTADELAAAAAIQDQADRQREAEAAETKAAALAAAREPAPIHALRPRRLYADEGERYLAIYERLGNGEPVSPDERAWFDAYEQRGAGGGPARTG